jgi:tetratricopeptide (TPR) repeat protein
MLKSTAVRRLSWVPVVAALLTTTPGSAAGTNAPAPAPATASSEDAAVKQAYRDANAEYALGNFAAALKKFEYVFRVKQLPGLLFNIAQCHRQLREFDQAANTYRSFIRLDPANPQVDRAKELLKQVEDSIRTQNQVQRAPPLDANGSDPLPRKTSSEPELQPTTTVEVTPPPSAAKPLPSAKTGTAIATPGLPAETKITGLEPSAAKQPAPKASTSPAAPLVLGNAPKPPEQKSSKHILAWTGVGVGAAAIAGGVIFGSQSSSAKDDLSKGSLTRAQADDKVSTMQRDATLGNVLLIGGVVVLAGAVACFFLGAP